MRKSILVLVFAATFIAGTLANPQHASAVLPDQIIIDGFNNLIATMADFNTAVLAAFDAIGIEATNRAAGDTALQSNIDSEVAARKQGDADTLDSAKMYTDQQVAAEASARASGDSDLQNKIGQVRYYEVIVPLTIDETGNFEATGQCNTGDVALNIIDAGNIVIEKESRANGQQLFFTGKLKVTGNTDLAVQLQCLFTSKD